MTATRAIERDPDCLLCGKPTGQFEDLCDACNRVFAATAERVARAFGRGRDAVPHAVPGQLSVIEYASTPTGAEDDT